MIIIFISLNYINNYYIKYRDSYLLLPSSLKKLTISLGVEENGIFPYRFVNNKQINLDS